MTTLNVTETREKLPQILNQVYFGVQTFTVTKRGIPIAQIVPLAKKISNKVGNIKQDLQKAIRSARNIKGVWNQEWKDKPTIEIAKLLREKALYSHAS